MSCPRNGAGAGEDRPGQCDRPPLWQFVCELLVISKNIHYEHRPYHMIWSW